MLGLAVIAALWLILKGGNIIPQVTVSDQPIINGRITVSSVIAIAPSWLVIQTETNGVPGPVVGYAKMNKGVNNNVSVNIDALKSTPKLFAMIHEDGGVKGKFDFPNNDMPLLYKGEMVSKIFTLQ